MRIGVVIINYNKSEFLSRCLESVLCQADPPDQVVFADDGSTDNSLAVFYKYSYRLPSFKLLEGFGPSGAAQNRHRAISACDEEYFVTLDSDDFFSDPMAISRIRSEIIRKPRSIYVSSFSVVDQSGNLLRSIDTSRFVSASRRSRVFMLGSRHPALPGNQLCCSKRDYFSVGGVNLSFRLYEDWEFFLRAHFFGLDFAHVQGCGFSYRKTTVGLSSAHVRFHVYYLLRAFFLNFKFSSVFFWFALGFVFGFIRRFFKFVSFSRDPVGYN